MDFHSRGEERGRLRAAPALWLAPVFAGALAVAMGASQATDRCPGYSSCPAVYFPDVLAENADALAVRRANAVEKRNALLRFDEARPGAERKALLGAILVHDETLSVEKNQACASCHASYAGFSGPVALINKKTAANPGSVAMRAGLRKPMSLAYATYAPVLAYNNAASAFVGGNFWDMRATGLVTGSASADQAQAPFTSPFEMAMPDPACVVYRVARGAYRAKFEEVWSGNAFAVRWPAGTATACARPNSSADADPRALVLAAVDRKQAQATFKNIALSIAAYEASSDASPFSSKFDAVQAGKAKFTPAERAGFALFTGGRAKCSNCHTAAGKPVLFTNFQAFNIGTPRNPDIPYLSENRPDGFGYVANSDGGAFVDLGLGGFLASSAVVNSAWKAQAPFYKGAFRTPTLRNVDKRPRPAFAKSYAHNGYFPSLKALVHFYNTRGILDRCPDGLQRYGDTNGSKTVGYNCWPASEVPATVNWQFTGRLGLSDLEESQIVAFLRTLSDGYDPSSEAGE